MKINRHWATYYVKSTLDRIPVIYLAALRFKHRGSAFLRRIVSADSDICIEGHNRSANSFAVKAFREANDTAVKQHRIATHVHASAQVLKAIDLGIPTMVLIRKPEDTVVSQKSLAIQLQQVVSAEDYPLEIFLHMYVDFYQRLLPQKNRILVVPFEKVTVNFSDVMVRFNSRFGTSFNVIEHSKEAEAQIFQSSRVHLSPSKEREKIKSLLIDQLKSLEESKVMRQACLIYQEFTS